MPTTIIELVESRAETVSEEAPAAELLYTVHGTEDENVARALVDRTIPAIYIINHSRPDFLTPRAIRTVFQSYGMRHMGAGVWDVRAQYGKRSPSRLNDHTYNFDTGGGTTHITQSIKTVDSEAINAAGEPVPAPDMFGAINVDNERVAGVDIGLAVYKWSETWFWKNEDITSDYRKLLKKLTKTVCDQPFREFEAGEVLFEGVSGVKSTNEDYVELTYHFAQSDNSDRSYQGNLQVPDKKGWEYVWFRYEDYVDPMSGRPVMVKRPVAAYVEQVYDERDFFELGIGVEPLD